VFESSHDPGESVEERDIVRDRDSHYDHCCYVGLAIAIGRVSYAVGEMKGALAILAGCAEIRIGAGDIPGFVM